MHWLCCFHERHSAVQRASLAQREFSLRRTTRNKNPNTTFVTRFSVVASTRDTLIIPCCAACSDSRWRLACQQRAFTHVDETLRRRNVLADSGIFDMFSSLPTTSTTTHLVEACPSRVTLWFDVGLLHLFQSIKPWVGPTTASSWVDVAPGCSAPRAGQPV